MLLLLVAGHRIHAQLVGPEVPAARVSRSELVQKVVASGRVLPPARVVLGSPLVATVDDVAVEEGEHVAAGQLLVRLFDRVEQAAVEQARAALSQAQARVGQIRTVTSRVTAARLRQAAVSLLQAEQKHRRIKALADRHVASQADLEETVKALELARSQQQAAAAEALSAAPAGSERQQALFALAQARAALAGAEARLAQTRIVAPGSGTILARSVEAGDLVQPGRSLLVLARDGRTRLVFAPEEKNLSLLQQGQRARASADAYPDEVFEAVIASIAPAVDPLRGTVEVKLDVARPPAFLRPDMTVSINVEVARRPDAVVIPAEAVREADSGRPWVMVAADGRAARRTIRLGARGQGMLEVRQGLAVGETVLLAGARPLREGARVRPAPGEAAIAP